MPGLEPVWANVTRNRPGLEFWRQVVGFKVQIKSNQLRGVLQIWSDLSLLYILSSPKNNVRLWQKKHREHLREKRGDGEDDITHAEELNYLKDKQTASSFNCLLIINAAGGNHNTPRVLRRCVWCVCCVCVTLSRSADQHVNTADATLSGEAATVFFYVLIAEQLSWREMISRRSTEVVNKTEKHLLMSC